MKRLLGLKRNRILLLLPVALIILIISMNFTFVAEYVFARGLYKLISLPLGVITGLLPFSLSEVIIIIAPFAGIFVFTVYITRIIIGKGERKFIAGKGLLNLLCGISIFVFAFVVLCGTNYYRYDFEEYCDFQTEEHTTEELYSLCIYLRDMVNETKAQINEVDENGVVKFQRDFSALSKEANNAMGKLSKEYPVLRYSTGGAKEVCFSRYMSYGGIVGIFIPFTMEANVNTDVADYNRPADTCHELAHMRGFMKEEEANYIAYLACIGYDDPAFKYSGYMLAFIHSTNALYKYDAAAYQEVMEGLTDLVLSDIIYENKYWDELRENETAQVIDSITTSVNDTYLKVNGQEDGVKSYGQMVDLLLADYLSTRQN